VPTYEYRCNACDHRFERFQKMSDKAVEECELCSGVVERVLFPVAVHFKGSGFYTTDYAKKKGLSASSNGNGDNPDKSETSSPEPAKEGKSSADAGD